MKRHYKGIISVSCLSPLLMPTRVSNDLDKQNVLYVLHKGNNATNDFFTFKVTDVGGNELADQIFRLNWAWISLEYESYTVNETEMFLRVNLRRRGYLGETSFVGLRTVDLSARKGVDYHKSYAKQVQFNPGQSEAMWRVRVLQDGVYERNEQFQIVLEEPIMAVLEPPTVASVTISDDEDESVVFFPDKRIEVQEDVGELHIPMQRSGDLSKELMVLCSTEPGTAMGTIPSTVLSYSDYISRAADHTSVVRFAPEQDAAVCRVVVIDDSLLEDEEWFRVLLTMPMGGRLGSSNATDVAILPDDDDSPFFYFGDSVYHVNESDGHLVVTVWRSGTDLSRESTVIVKSKPSDPPSAEAGQDYVGVGRTLQFPSASASQSFRVTVLDDVGRPQLEGVETFELFLRMPVNAIIGDPGRTTVTISDSISDLPQMQFRDASYTVFENNVTVTAVVTRSGDLSHPSSVRCYTRQNTALVQLDFEERPDTNASLVAFSPGDSEKPCKVILIDDHIYEPDEDFRLVLGSPGSSVLADGALVGPRNFTRILIKDDADKPIIKFAKTRFYVREPKRSSDVSTVEVPVVRVGDLSHVSIVRIHTKDGSAKSGEDYHGLSKELLFAVNVTRLTIPIEILFDSEKEHREAFTVHLKPDKNLVAEIKDTKVIIYIQEDDVIADVTFPSPPIVISLRDYDDIGPSAKAPIPGYPVVCVTPCNPKHPEFIKMGSLCTKEGVNDSLTEFRWRVAAPSGTEGIVDELKDLESNMLFMSTKRITLDSIYFTGGCKVQCAARAVNTEGCPGLELFSPVVTISRSEGVCMPRTVDSFGAEPFTAKLRYTGPYDPKHPNLVQLSVVLPHRDGMLPVVSTRPLSNFELSLSPNGARVGDHKCSNLLDVDEIRTKHGFITSAITNPNVIGELEPYQYNEDLRSAPTLRFYRHLDLEGCMWEFMSYYSMSELISECGGSVTSDGQILNLVQSYLSVELPIYVSYVYHSSMAMGGWRHNDLSSSLRLSFVYDTSILWQQGIGPPQESHLHGNLHPSSMNIRTDGCLVVRFRTEAHFRGQFLLNHPGTAMTSSVVSPDHENLTFKLELIRSEPSLEQPQQEWQFVSDYAVRDYSGLYVVKLLPCTVPDDVTYSAPLMCAPKEPIDFELRLRFQQVSDPVAARYSLNTQFHLVRKRELWLTDGGSGQDLGDNSDTAFEPGDSIYGRIMVDPVQSLGQSFHVIIEKCFLCTGVDGYIPKYDPIRNEFGCMTNSPSLLFSFKLIDKGAPGTVQKEIRNVPFNAVLADDDEDSEVARLVRQPGSDGFRLDSAPLFQVSHGRQWFIQCIYTISSRERLSQHGIGKRSTSGPAVSREYHVISSASLYYNGSAPSSSTTDTRRTRRFTGPVDDIGDNGRGTNMHSILLDYGSSRRTTPVSGSRGLDGQNEGGGAFAEVELSPFPSWLSAVAILLLVVATAVALLVTKRRRRQQRAGTNGSAGVLDPSTKCDISKSATVMTVIDVKGNAATIIVPRYYGDNTQDNTEV